jgi:hypothetical protein
MSTDVRDCPEHVVSSKPSETSWEDNPFAKVKLASAEFDQVPERNEKEHECQGEALHNIYSQLVNRRQIADRAYLRR